MKEEKSFARIFLLSYLDRGFSFAALLVAGSTASTRLDFLSLEMDGLALRFLSTNK